MTAPFNPRLAGTAAPPVMEARRWIAGRSFPPDKPLLNLSQAAPTDPPPPVLRQAIATAALDDPQAHLYGPVLGDTALREAVAERWSSIYGGEIGLDSVAITAGCNQAFCAAVATVAAPGEAVILPTPWYFNHQMWLDMAGIHTVPLPCGAAGLPDPERARALIGPDVRALTLITPNNPTGAEYPPALITAFFELCASKGIALILDETYRDFRTDPAPPHDLFARDDWADTLIHLYSFSKVYRLTGHRVGALVAGAARIGQAEKFLDTVTICPGRLGQVAALAGLRELDDWVAVERNEVLSRRARLVAGFAQGVAEWRLCSAGAYFAFVEHPFAMRSDAVAKALVTKESLLALPGTMFAPTAEHGGDGRAERTIRLAFANAEASGIYECLARLRRFRP